MIPFCHILVEGEKGYLGAFRLVELKAQYHSLCMFRFGSMLKGCIRLWVGLGLGHSPFTFSRPFRIRINNLFLTRYRLTALAPSSSAFIACLS